MRYTINVEIVGNHNSPQMLRRVLQYADADIQRFCDMGFDSIAFSVMFLGKALATVSIIKEES